MWFLLWRCLVMGGLSFERYLVSSFETGFCVFRDHGFVEQSFYGVLGKKQICSKWVLVKKTYEL